MGKRKATKRASRAKSGGRPARRRKRSDVLLRLPVELLEKLDEMAAEVGMSRNALASLMLRQGIEFARTADANPGLFAPTEQLINAALRRAFAEGGDAK